MPLHGRFLWVKAYKYHTTLRLILHWPDLNHRVMLAGGGASCISQEKGKPSVIDEQSSSCG